MGVSMCVCVLDGLKPWTAVNHKKYKMLFNDKFKEGKLEDISFQGQINQINKLRQILATLL